MPLLVVAIDGLQIRVYWKNWLSVITAYFITSDRVVATWQHKFFWFSLISRSRAIQELKSCQ